MCLCVCEWEREIERAREKERVRKRVCVLYREVCGWLNTIRDSLYEVRHIICSSWLVTNPWHIIVVSNLKQNFVSHYTKFVTLYIVRDSSQTLDISLLFQIFYRYIVSFSNHLFWFAKQKYMSMYMFWFAISFPLSMSFLFPLPRHCFSKFSISISPISCHVISFFCRWNWGGKKFGTLFCFP